MSGLFGVVGAVPVPDGAVDRGLAASPHRWKRGHRSYRDRHAALVWSAAMEDGVPTPEAPPAGEMRAVLATSGRFAEITGRDARAALPHLPELWAQNGTDLMHRLLGDWVLAAWHPEARTLHLARDPLGQRTLYVRDEGNRLTFANDIPTLAAVAPGLSIDGDSVQRWVWGRFLDPCTTMFEGVEQVPPGSVLRWSAQGRGTDRPASWSIEPLQHENEDEYVEHFLEIFSASVRARTAGGRSALLLSGGLDSPMIAALAARAGADVVAYTYRTRAHPSADESQVACDVADALGVEIVTVDWDAAPPLDGFPALGPEPDDPYIGAYQASLDHVYARAADRGATNLLSGDRGDLVLGDTVYGHLEMLLDGAWGTLLGDLDHERRRQETSWIDILNRYVARPLASSLLARPVTPGRPPTSDGSGPPWLLGTPPATDTHTCAGTYEPPGTRAYGRRQRFRTVYTPMHTMGATWTERHASQHGLSAGDPWSDARVVDFVLRSPQSILNRTRDRKRLARLALRRLLPDALVDRLGKVDPGPVFDHRMAAVAPEVRALLDAPRSGARGWLDVEPLRRHYEAFVGGAPLDPRFWWAITAEWWLRNHWT